MLSKGEHSQNIRLSILFNLKNSNQENLITTVLAKEIAQHRLLY